MRRALLKRMPALMRDYGLMPWQIGDLTAAELNEILCDQDERVRAHNAAVRQQSKR